MWEWSGGEKRMEGKIRYIRYEKKRIEEKRR